MFGINPRLDAPELFEPGRKPTCNVKIDWNDQDAEGLTTCVIFQYGRYYELVTGRQVLLSPNAVQHPDGVQLNGVTTYAMIPDVVIGPDYTITFELFDPNPTKTGIGYFLSYGTVSTTGSISMALGLGVGGRVKTWANNSATDKSLNSAYTASPFMGIFSAAITGTTGILYANGNVDVANATYGTVAAPAGTKNDLYLGMRSDFDASRGWEGTFKLLYIHNRQLDAEAARRLSDNPFRFLIPV